jgi:TonB family protein
MIDGKLCGYDFYRNVDKSHIKNERPGTKEEKFIRGITVDLIVVTMKDGYGQTEAYFPETASKDASDKALLDFVSKNVKYSKSALDNNIEGLITVRYTVRENGELTDFKIVKSLGWGLDEEVLKVMDKLAETKGLWTAALLDGKPITTSAILPVKFKLPKSNKLNTIKFSTIPNPSNGIFNVVYQLDRDTPVNLTFYSVDGKVVKRMLNLPAENNINIDLSSQNLPLVYITLEQEGKTKTIKTTFQN